MLHPSYTDLMEVINSDVEEGEQPVVSSRYSIVIAAAKRARQIIAGSEPLVDGRNKKPLSIAVEELYKGKVKILRRSARLWTRMTTRSLSIPTMCLTYLWKKRKKTMMNFSMTRKILMKKRTTRKVWILMKNK